MRTPKTVLSAVVVLVSASHGSALYAADTRPGPAAAPTTAAPKPRVYRAPPKPVAPSLPAPQVTLDIEPSASGPNWTMRIKNTDAAPLRVVTDPRLLRITLPPAPAPVVKGKKAPKSVVCSLPTAARPQGDGDARVIQPGKTYTQKFDVRMLCFSDEATLALEAATRLSAAYGFDSKSIAFAPYVVGPLDPTFSAPQPTIANAKDIAMAERDLGPHAVAGKPNASAPTAASPGTSAGSATSGSAAATAPPNVTQGPAKTPDDGGLAPPRLTLRETARIDADTAEYASISVSLTNESSRSVALAFRPNALVLEVTSPSGRRATCNVAGQTALARDLVGTVAPGRTASLAVVLGRFCPDGTFDERGIHSVLARIDTRKTQVLDASPGLFVGEVASTVPTLVRIRRGDLPIVSELKATFD